MVRTHIHDFQKHVQAVTVGWNVVIPTGDQIKEQQHMDAYRSVEV